MRKIIKFDAIDSTNDTMMSLADLMSLPSGSVVQSNFQNRGKGQPGKVWFSSWNKNLLFSLLLKFDNLSIEKQFILNKAVSLAIVKSISHYLPNVEIKWPNDIFVNNKKLAGILIENSISGNKISHSVIGIGLNVLEKDFPLWIPNPTSILLEGSNVDDLNRILENICSNIESEVRSMKLNEKNIINSYMAKLYKKDKVGVYQSKGKIFNAILRGVDEKGRLILELEDGSHEFFSNGQIKFLN